MTCFRARYVLLLLSFLPVHILAQDSDLHLPFAEVWSYLRTDTLRYLPAGKDERNLYVVLNGGHVLALRLTNGDRVWEVHEGGEFTVGPQVSHEAVYVALQSKKSEDASVQSHLLTLDKKTGRKESQRDFDDRITSLTHSPPPQGRNLPRLYVGTESGTLFAFATPTQEPVWKFQAGGAIRSLMTLEGGVIYFGCDDGHLYAVDAQTGNPRWQFKADGPIRARVEVSLQRLFAGSHDGYIYCLDKESGKQLWRMRTGAAIQAKPVLVNDQLIVLSFDNYVYAFNPMSGTLRWKVQLSGRIIADPIVRGDAVLASVIRDHRVTILQAADGKSINTVEIGNEFEIVAPPMMAGRTLILITDQGLIAARSATPTDTP